MNYAKTNHLGSAMTLFCLHIAGMRKNRAVSCFEKGKITVSMNHLVFAVPW